MKRNVFLTLVLLSIISNINAQDLKSPDQFLGYELGTQFTMHHEAVSYFKYLSEASPLVELKQYGRSYEGRPLIAVFVSSESNMQNIEVYRKTNLAKIGLGEGGENGTQIPFVWLSYNVHGNESVGLETAMKTLYTLVTKSYTGSEDWLNETIIIIDPCQNPDGRDLYAFRYRKTQTSELNYDSDAFERNQGWPSARANHYSFDLNRDWTWQTQIETQQRLDLYKQYMPQVHADFHEMGSGSTYFFAPGAEPWHEVITPWQHNFHELMGDGNAELFDDKFRLYFTKESFDLFCPSFGDTWPLFNGAMGFTYEQGGGGRAGLALALNSGDTISLKKRIDGHFMSSMATIKVSYENRDKLISEFNKFFTAARENPPFEYKSIIIKGSNSKASLKSLTHLLKSNQIRFNYSGSVGKKFRGFDYLNNKDGEVSIEKGDILISAYQPQSRFVQVLFEPDSKYSDSLSYDLTGWALPYIYNLKSYAIRDKIQPSNEEVQFSSEKNGDFEGKPYAYLVNREGFDALRFMSKLYKQKIKIRYALKPFEIDGVKYNRGSVIITRGDNIRMGEKLDKDIQEAANQTGVKLHATTTGMVQKGKDFGSGNARLTTAPQIALVGGVAASSSSYGELWYFFEQELEYPVTLIGSDYLSSVDLTKYDVVILPSGSYSRYKDPILSYLKQGGKVLAFERASSLFSSEKTTGLFKALEAKNEEDKKEKPKVKSDDPELLKKFEDQRRHSLSNRSASSIYKVSLDDTHPYAFGMGSEWFIIKRSSGYPYLQSGNNIAYIKDAEPVSGFAGYKYQKEIQNSLVIGSERIGRGEVIYLSDSPYYRAFWKSGAQLIGNMVFF